VSSSLKISALPDEQAVILFPATFNHLQGHVPALFQALTAACADTFPPIPVLSQYETLNKVSQPEPAHDYIEQDPSFAASRLLPRHRLQQIRAALGARYVLQPGLAYVSEEMDDKFEFGGFVFVRTRVNTMGLWLRLWDAQTGEFLWESAGEATVGAELLNPSAAVPFHEIARKLWRHMIQEGLLDGKSTSRTFFKEEFPVEP
jgi:hypothetical protein